MTTLADPLGWAEQKFANMGLPEDQDLRLDLVDDDAVVHNVRVRYSTYRGKPIYLVSALDVELAAYGSQYDAYRAACLYLDGVAAGRNITLPRVQIWVDRPEDHLKKGGRAKI